MGKSAKQRAYRRSSLIRMNIKSCYKGSSGMYDILAYGNLMCPAMATAFIKADLEVKKYNGVGLIVSDCFCTEEIQEGMLNEFKLGKRKGPVASPGHSLHECGRAVKICIDPIFLKPNPETHIMLGGYEEDAFDYDGITEKELISVLEESGFSFYLDGTNQPYSPLKTPYVNTLGLKCLHAEYRDQDFIKCATNSDRDISVETLIKSIYID